jgi:hypothetical protein
MQHVKFAKMIGYEVAGGEDIGTGADTIAELLASETGGGLSVGGITLTDVENPEAVESSSC